MKLYKFSLFLLAGAAMFASCDDKEATQPTAAISVDKYVYDVNESMTLRFIGNADNVVVYPGDENQDYELRDQSNTGLVVNKGLLTYAYEKPGTYHVVCVATNHEDAGKSVKTDTTSVWVRVIDEVVDIDGVTAMFTYYEIPGTAVNNTDWMLALPRKFRYNKKDVPVNLKKHKLSFDIASTTTEIGMRTLENEDEEYTKYSSNASYNLENNLHLMTTSSSGMHREYNLFTLNYGEFKTFSLAGVKGTLDRSEFDYSLININMTLPSGTDLTAVPVDFTLYDNDSEKVFVGDQEIHTGDVVDFSEPVTFRFVVTKPGYEHIKAESTCVVTATVG